MSGFESKRAQALDKLNSYLVERVLTQIVKDVESGDLTAIEELLFYCDEEAMRQYLPEVDTMY